jgi:hypothetical protein
MDEIYEQLDIAADSAHESVHSPIPALWPGLTGKCYSLPGKPETRNDKCFYALPLTRISGTNRIHLALFDMQNRTSGPYLAAIHRFLISLDKSRLRNPTTPVQGALSQTIQMQDWFTAGLHCH